MLIVSVGLKTDESTCLASKHCFLVYIWVNACVLGGLQLSSVCIYCFICLCSFLFCIPMHIYLYLCDSVWNEVSLPMGVLIVKRRMYIQCEMCAFFVEVCSFEYGVTGCLMNSDSCASNLNIDYIFKSVFLSAFSVILVRPRSCCMTCCTRSP